MPVGAVRVEFPRFQETCAPTMLTNDSYPYSAQPCIYVGNYEACHAPYDSSDCLAREKVQLPIRSTEHSNAILHGIATSDRDAHKSLASKNTSRSRSRSHFRWTLRTALGAFTFVRARYDWGRRTVGVVVMATRPRILLSARKILYSALYA